MPQFRGVVDTLRSITARSAIIDGELVACGDNDAPDFRALQARHAMSAALCIWAFDLLYLDGRNRQLPASMSLRPTNSYQIARPTRRKTATSAKCRTSRSPSP
jgi:ATP-dependent DNA ligase